MDRKRFLSLLKRTLWWRLPPEDLLSVLEDYNEYFDNGIAEGKSEQELCTRFGEPRTIAADLVAERGSRYYTTSLISMTLCGGLLLLVISMVFQPWSYLSSISSNLINIAILVMSCLSTLFALRTAGMRPSRKLARWVCGLNLLVVLLAAGVFAMTITLTSWADFVSQYVVRPEMMGQYAAIIVLVVAALTAVLWLVVVFGAAALRRGYLVLISINAAVLAMLAGVVVIMSSLTDPDMLIGMTLKAAAVAMIQLIPAIFVLIPHKKGDK